MKSERGNIDPLLVPLIVSIVLVVGLAGFGIWSYSNYLDQKNNTQDKIDVAVEEAKAVQAEELEADFAEREKRPNRTFLSDSSIGSIEFKYPKTWSAFVDSNPTSSKALEGLFHPKEVPADDTLYALRILVNEASYSREVSGYDRDVEKGLVSVKPVTVKGTTGVRIDGQLDTDYRGSLLIFPLRDKTVQIWTESEAYLVDFERMLETLTFEP